MNNDDRNSFYHIISINWNYFTNLSNYMNSIRIIVLYNIHTYILYMTYSIQTEQGWE